MSELLAKLAGNLTHRWRVSLVAALVALVAVGLLAANGKPGVESFTVPGTDTHTAVELLKKHTPAMAGVDSQVVFIAKKGKVTDPPNKASIERALAKISELRGVTLAPSPFNPKAPGISRDGRVAQTTVQYSLDPLELEIADGRALVGAVESVNGPSLTGAARGQVADAQDEPGAPVGELIGIAIAVILLTLLFRSLSAMGATLFGALLGVALGQMAISALAEPMGLPKFASVIAMMLGLGAGIDYSLLIIGRFREQAAAGYSIRDSSAKAAATSGSAVVTAGLVVMVAIAGLMVTGVPLLGKMGIGAAIGVGAVVVSALTALPIMIGAFQRRLRPKRFSQVAPSKRFTRWGELVADNPWKMIAGGVAVLLILGSPVLDIRLGQPDDGSKPTHSTQRVAYENVSKGFGPGTNGPLLLVVKTPHDDRAAAVGLAKLRERVAGVPGIVAVTPPTRSRDGAIATIVAIPATSPQDKKTSDLLKRLREDVIPAATGDSRLEVYVGGNTAGFEDLANKTAAGLPVFIAVVVGMSVILLMAAFRSLWIPIVSALFNLLSVAAAYGVIVAVFQKGFGAGLLGVGDNVPIVSVVPVMIFAILFGLSMDYNVFLLSRIHEAAKEGDGPRASVVHGMGRIGAVILYAGMIMAAVFSAFVTQPDVITKMFGIGLGLAILIDVVILRLIVAPAVVALLGEQAWTLPVWLDRLLPNVSLEGHLVKGKDPQGPPVPGHP